MKQQSNPDDVERLSQEDHDGINRHGVVGMQRMKVDAASVSLENGVSQ